MAFARWPSIEQFRNIFLLAFLVLVVTIIFTPLLIRKGFYLFAEETWEAVLLFIQVSLAWNIFRLYEKAIATREKEIKKLESEYQKREKELLETFAYLGKLNVEVSLIRDFLQKVKTPATKKEVKEYLNDILHIALSISRKKWMMVRIINTQIMQTVAEHRVALPKSKIGEEMINIGNREIIEMAQNKNLCNKKSLCVLPSVGSKPYEEKAFLIFQEDNSIDREILDFLKAVANQCEIIHTLFILGHGKK